MANVLSSQPFIQETSGYKKQNYATVWRYCAALAAVSVACGVQFLYNFLGFNGTIPFAILMIVPTYISGRQLSEILYNGDFKVVSIISFSTIFWYFSPLILLCLGFNGLSLSIDSDRILNSSMLIVISLLMVLPFIFLECFFKNSFVKEMSNISLKSSSLFFAFCSFFQVVLIVTGKWTYGSLLLAGVRQDMGESAQYLQIANLISIAAMPFSAYILGRILSENRAISANLFFVIAEIFSGMMWNFIGGRRYFIVEIGMSCVLYLSARYKNAGKKLKISTVMQLLIVSLGVISVAAPAYFAVRLASESVSKGRQMPGIGELLASSKGVGNAQMSRGYDQKVVDRSAIIGSVSTVSETNRDFSYGYGLYNSIMMALPPQIFNKSRLYKTPEDLWYTLGVPYDDYSNTLVLDSYVDFNFFGYAIYLFIICSMIIISLNLMEKFKYFSLLYKISFVFLFLNTETGVSTYFVQQRNMLVIFFALIVFELVHNVFKVGPSKKDRA